MSETTLVSPRPDEPIEREEAGILDLVTQVRQALTRSLAEAEPPFRQLRADLLVHFQRGEATCRRELEGHGAGRELIHHLKNEQAAVTFALDSLILRLAGQAATDAWAAKFERLAAKVEAYLQEVEQVRSSARGEGPPR